MEAKPYKPPVRELAARIYVELAVRALSAGEGPRAPGNAAPLAKLSFELAEAFQAVEDQLNAANLPRNTGFKLGNEDISAWTK